MKFDFFNDTGREVRIHPATFESGCEVNAEKIQPLETGSFMLLCMKEVPNTRKLNGKYFKLFSDFICYNIKLSGFICCLLK
ncbi:hypothetical protein [Paenibacillus sp. 843]|uniref:hypothetical protein n=1 Tax=Paenibacillus sp. 843 TaxID=3341795 RepID=UPI003729C94F